MQRRGAGPGAGPADRPCLAQETGNWKSKLLAPSPPAAAACATGQNGFALGKTGVLGGPALGIPYIPRVQNGKEAAQGQEAQVWKPDGVGGRPAALPLSLHGGVRSTLRGGLKLTGFGYPANLVGIRDGKCSKEF